MRPGFPFAEDKFKVSLNQRSCYLSTDISLLTGRTPRNSRQRRSMMFSKPDLTYFYGIKGIKWSIMSLPAVCK